MKVTFPHLGNTYIGAKILFDGLNIDYVLPPLTNKTALEIGVSNSPEDICLPFKIMIGNYIQSIEKGADTILIVGSCGPCRFGEYCELQMNLLRKLGYDLDFVVVDYSKEIGINGFLNRIKKIHGSSPKSAKEKMKAALMAYKAINLIDSIEATAHKLSGYEINKGDFKRLLYNCKKDVIGNNNPEEALNILSSYEKRLYKVPVNMNKNPLKIAIIGEIYTIIEPFSNLNIEEKLMDYGVCSSRKLTPSWWVKDTMLKVFKLNSLDIKHASKEYLKYPIGGHGKECVGEAILAKDQGLDGAIQIFPLGCMPEIVSKAILPNISKEYNFPIMTLVVDEMTGENGYITRIEAFLDMLERRQKRVLYGC